MKAHLLISQTNGRARRLHDEAFEVWFHSGPSPEHPDHSDDAAAVWMRENGNALLAVADGMGGTPQGAESAAEAIRQLDTGVRAASAGGDLRSVVLDAFERANREILDRFSGSGTTLVVCELFDGEVRTYNAGDSAAILMGQRGRLKLETIAHSPVGYGVAAGLIDPEAALQHEDRHYLSNHLGSRSMHVELGTPRSMALRDTLLLASDGLMDNIPPEELREIVRCGRLGDAARQLVDLCETRMNGRDPGIEGKPDDMTFLLLRRAST